MMEGEQFLQGLASRDLDGLRATFNMRWRILGKCGMVQYFVEISLTCCCEILVVNFLLFLCSKFFMNGNSFVGAWDFWPWIDFPSLGRCVDFLGNTLPFAYGGGVLPFSRGLGQQNAIKNVLFLSVIAARVLVAVAEPLASFRLRNGKIWL